MSTEDKLYAATIQGFHGRPMCCAQKMAATNSEPIKRDGSIRQWYCCIACQKRIGLYFKAPDVLHNNQTPRLTGKIPKRTTH